MESVLQLKKKLTWIAAVLLFVSLSLACSKKVHFATSTVVPAAEGTVKVKKDKNNNYGVDIEIRNLAEPKRLPQPQNVYVVWIETENNGVQNLGRLNTSSGLLSNTLKASLTTVTPYKPTRIFITAEDEATVQYPGNYVVLNTSSF